MAASPALQFYSLRPRILAVVFAIIIVLICPVKTVGNVSISPVVWPSDPLRDPYHIHSGHVIRRAGSNIYEELDLLSFPSPSMKNSVSILLFQR